MEEVKKTGFKAFLDSAKGYIAGVMAILGAASFIFALGIKSERKDSGSKAVVDSIASFSKEIRLVRKDVNQLTVEVGVVIEKQTDQKVAYNSLRLVVLDLVKREPGMTLEQFQQYLENTPILKKNESSQLILSYPIPYSQGILYTSKLTSKK